MNEYELIIKGLKSRMFSFRVTCLNCKTLQAGSVPLVDVLYDGGYFCFCHCVKCKFSFKVNLSKVIPRLYAQLGEATEL